MAFTLSSLITNLWKMFSIIIVTQSNSLTLTVLGMLVETVKKSVLQARNPHALAKNDRTGLARVIERIKKRGTMRNCLSITQS